MSSENVTVLHSNYVNTLSLNPFPELLRFDFSHLTVDSQESFCELIMHNCKIYSRNVSACSL